MTLRPADVTELQEIVRDAHNRAATLKIIGRNTWQGAINSSGTALDLSQLSGIVEYVPGDLTLTARAGTTIAEINAATAAHGQWCPLNPWGTDSGSLGATIATATTGPTLRSLGAPRDLAIGLQFVDGTGALVRGGGRVVKNVAGFDLTRLLTGSWGTLGAIAEVSVRLRALPQVDETWSVGIGEASADRLHEFTQGSYTPLSCELIGAQDALSLGVRGEMLIRIAGNASFVAASRTALKQIGPADAHDASVWTRYRALDPSPRTVTAAAFADALSQRVKDQFDPARILNRLTGEHAAGRAA